MTVHRAFATVGGVNVDLREQNACFAGLLPNLQEKRRKNMSYFQRQAHSHCHASLTISTISPSTAATLQKEEDVGCVTRYTDPISNVDENPLLLLKLLRGDFRTTVGGFDS
jgi:hypothetical protein